MPIRYWELDEYEPHRVTRISEGYFFDPSYGHNVYWPEQIAFDTFTDARAAQIQQARANEDQLEKIFNGYFKKKGII